MSSWSMPSPLTPIAPINTPLRYNGNPPGKIVMPLGKFGLGGQEAGAVEIVTPLRTLNPVKPENRSCKPRNGPGAVLLIPGGYRLCARNPTVRLEKAR